MYVGRDGCTRTKHLLIDSLKFPIVSRKMKEHLDYPNGKSIAFSVQRSTFSPINNHGGSKFFTLNFSLFSVHGLASGDGDHVVDVFHGAAAREVVHRTGNTLKNGADGDGVA